MLRTAIYAAKNFFAPAKAINKGVCETDKIILIDSQNIIIYNAL